MNRTFLRNLLITSKLFITAEAYAAAMDENDLNGHVLNNLDVVHHFMCSYCIDSVSEDALLKNFYRWRENMRKRKVRREYKKKLKFC